MQARVGEDEKRDPTKAQSLFFRKSVARPIAIHMWSPMNGVLAAKAPSPIDQPTSHGEECSLIARCHSRRRARNQALTRRR
jgi:hypothetical protein